MSYEYCFGNVCFVHSKLMVTWLQIKLWINLGPVQFIQKLFNYMGWELIRCRGSIWRVSETHFFFLYFLDRIWLFGVWGCGLGCQWSVIQRVSETHFLSLYCHIQMSLNSLISWYFQFLYLRRSYSRFLIIANIIVTRYIKTWVLHWRKGT